MSFIQTGWLCMKLCLSKAWCLWCWLMTISNTVIKFWLTPTDTISVRLPDDALMSHGIMGNDYTFNFCFSACRTAVHEMWWLKSFPDKYRLLAFSACSLISSNFQSVQRREAQERNIKLVIFRLHKATLWPVVSYLQGSLWGPGWWCQWVAPGGCRWWWWRACWGWCCYLSCRVKCRVSCCNTERTGPGQRLDNWHSPVETDRVGEMVKRLVTYKDKAIKKKKNWEIKKDMCNVV